MKVISFRHAGRESYGVLYDDFSTVLDVGAHLGPGYPTLRDALNDPDALHRVIYGGVTGIKAIELPLRDVELLQPITEPGAHPGDWRELQGARGRDRVSSATRAFPACSCACRARWWRTSEPILRPRVSGDLDFEGELAVVIGRAGRYIKRGGRPGLHHGLLLLQRRLDPRLATPQPGTDAG